MLKMKISYDAPPDLLLTRASSAFDLRGKRPVFCYGDTIYNPFEGFIDEHIIAHEAKHEAQQGSDPGAWWDRFLSDEDFRFEQEVEAYRVQWASMKEGISDKNELTRQLYRIAGDLGSGMYGPPLPLHVTLRLIKGEVDVKKHAL